MAGWACYHRKAGEEEEEQEEKTCKFEFPVTPGAIGDFKTRSFSLFVGWRGKGPGSRGIAGKQPFLEEYQKDLDSTSEEQPKHAAVIRIVGSFFTSDFETLASGVAASNLSATPRPSSDPERVGPKDGEGATKLILFSGIAIKISLRHSTYMQGIQGSAGSVAI